MGTTAISVRYRPIRIGWCVSSINGEDFRKAIRLTTALWGGQFNPIIPIADVSLSSNLVKQFGVDILFPISASTEMTTFISRYPHLPWPLGAHEIFSSLGEGKGKFTNLADIIHPLRHIAENKKTKVSAVLPEWNPTDPIADSLLAMFGGYPTTLDCGVDYNAMYKGVLSCKSLKIKNRAAIPTSLLNSYYPRNITGVLCQGRQCSSLHEDGIFVGSTSNLMDLINFWNLRAAGIFLVFYDPNYAKRFDPLRIDLFKRIRKHIKVTEHRRFRICVWSSQNISMPPGWNKKDIALCTHSEHLWNGMNIKPCRPHCKPSSVLGNVENENNSLKLRVALPPSPLVEEFGTNSHHCAVEVSMQSYERSSNDQTFWFPPISELSTFVGKNAFWQNEGCRVSEKGIATMESRIASNISIRSIRIPTLFSGIFELAGISANPSNAGLICRRMLDQMGGHLQNCRAFKIPGVRSLLSTSDPLTAMHRDEILRHIGRGGFEPHKQLFLEPRKEPELTAGHVFDFLLRHDVFRAGLEPKCPNCLLYYWVPLDQLRDTVKCELCGHLFRITPLLHEERWKYRRSGLFGRNDHQAGGLAVAATLQQLDSMLFNNLKLFTTGMDLTFKNNPTIKCESDFVMMSYNENSWEYDGSSRVKMAIGECKTNGNITKEDVSNLMMVADAFDPKTLDVFLIFSKFGSFSSEEIELCFSAQRQHGHRIILLSREQLEAHRISSLYSLLDIALKSEQWFPRAGTLAQNVDSNH